ncbi:MAG: 2'-5' RNA ligase family protein [Nocardioides sp.]
MPTIGVAIAVPDPWGARLQDYRSTLGDDCAEVIPTHITLVLPYDVADAELPAVEQHLAQASTTTPSFRVRLRGTGTFRPVSPVVFVTVAEGIGGCEQLALSVRRGPLTCDLDYPYHPHVTVAHHLQEPLLDKAFEEMAGFECDFEVGCFALYVHHGEQGWLPTRDFPLAPIGEE